MANNSKGKQSKFELIIGAVDKFSNVFKRIDGGMAKITAGLGRLKGAMGSLSRASGLNRLAGAVSNVGGRMKNVVSEGRNLISTVTGLVGKLSLVFGVAGGGVFALAKNTANAGDAAGKASARAGVGVKIWQEYAHAASLSGVSNEQLEKTFINLQDTAIKAFKGDKNKSSLLKMAGINPKTAKGEIKNADTLLLELSDKVKALHNAGQGAKATNLVKGLLGDEGTKLMPMLLGGADGLKKMRLEAHKLGLVLSEEDVKASGEFNNGLANMLSSLKGIGYSIGRVLLPPLTKLMDKFSQWSAGQREVIGTRFAQWLDSLDIDQIWTSIEAGLYMLADLARAINSLVQFFGGWENVLIAVSAAISGKFIFAIGSLIAAFAKLGLAILATPVGWFMLACLAIGAAVYAIYKNWDHIVAYFQNLWQGVREAFERNWVEGVVKLLWNFNAVRLVAKGMNELIAYFTGFDMIEYGAKIIDSFGEGISLAWDNLMKWFTGKLKTFTDAWNKVKGIFGFGDDESSGVFLNDPSGGYQGTGLGAPLNMGADARGVVSESRTEHVEKQKVEIIVSSADGSGVSAHGLGSVMGDNLSLQVGQEAGGY